MQIETVVGIVGILVFWMVFVAGLLRIRSWEKAHPGAFGGESSDADREVPGGSAPVRAYSKPSQ